MEALKVVTAVKTAGCSREHVSQERFRNPRLQGPERAPIAAGSTTHVVLRLFVKSELISMRSMLCAAVCVDASCRGGKFTRRTLRLPRHRFDAVALARQ